MYKTGKRRFVLTRAYMNLPTASRFARTTRKLVIVCGLPLLILLLAALSVSGRAIIFGTVAPSHGTPGVGPKVILAQTPVPGNAQEQSVTLPDRTLVISNVSKVAGTNSGSTGISITISVKNIGTKSILNHASFYQLMVAEGDTFGLQSGTNSSFFGNIARQTARKGTLVFQVPTAALGGIRLLFRSEIATETVFIPLKV
jgi:hypothetical protein